MGAPTPEAPGQHHRVPGRRRADRARAVADVLRRQIHDGRFTTGALPGEPALGSEFAASRNTVREALALLRDEGLVERVPRLGTLVSGRKYDHGLDRLSGLNETLHTHGPVHNAVRLAQETAAPPGVARRLGLTEGAPVVHIERLRLLGGRPVSLDLTYLAPDVGLPLLEQDLEHNDVFALIAGVCGHRLGPAEVSLEAVNADPHSASVLHTPPGAALLLMERLTRLDGGRPVDLEYIRLRGDRITMSGRLDGPVPPIHHPTDTRR
ncbi:GntR family transcriptional regulator [Nocardiopsis sp. HNM0947]|uniref:GntR family transcriptional regulator n=1 Tax=Nocardiopsis coralli TaxID=2772213 RepID=A0ABR9PE32_9ACTN|nr:GntR family transcriptional regulator [Nocardiopsis coralli]MBE3002111.1 GntR family transcriptional regulator [Nocardiopsis coralli]